MLEELGVPYQHIPALPLGRAIQASNPLGKVPALVETDGNHQKYFSMYESGAINTYLGDLEAKLERHNTDNHVDCLVPESGTQLRGLYEQTVSCILCELDSQGLWIHRKHQALGHIFGFIPDAVKHAQDQFHRVNQVLAQQVRDNPSRYLVGDHFTAADILYVHCLEWSQSIGWDDPWKTDSVLFDYFRSCTQRPAYRTVAEIRRQEIAAKQSKL
jgi:glutathione S-transferase